MRLVICFFITWLFATSCFSQEARALVIGIDTYTPPKGTILPIDNDRILFPDLRGCKNDAIAIKAVLQSHYLIAEKNIATLFDLDASRENIFKKIYDLLEISHRGDIVFMFYAGHGSQVNNSLSLEPDKKDETIVPSDVWKHSGMDITDKELSRIFNKFIDKGIKLTVVFDCCHSGSLSRSLTFDPPTSRFMPGSSFDVKDSVVDAAPETRDGADFLILSAAQDFESAVEMVDENSLIHGVFTNAFLKAINQQTSDASVLNLYQATRSYLKANGYRQEPVLGASAQRANQTLLGTRQGIRNEKMLIPAIGTNKDFVEIAGGFAQELYIGHELSAVTPSNDTIVLRVDSVVSITNSLAKVIKGDKAAIYPGMLFEITNWVSNRSPLLKVFISDYAYTIQDIQKITETVRQLKKQAPLQWMNDFSKEEPGINFFIRDGQYSMNKDGRQIELVKKHSARDLLTLSGNRKFNFDIPPVYELVQNIKRRMEKNGNIQFVDNAAASQYILYGTINDREQVSYGWRKAQLSLKDSLESMPLQSRFFALTEEKPATYEKLADSLALIASRLAKIKGWLQLSGPLTTDPFPFHMELRNQQSGISYDSLPARIDQKVSLHLVANTSIIKRNSKQKFIYVFVIDKDGTMTLLFPNSATGNVENRFPRVSDGKIVGDVVLNNFTIGLPTGTDNYFLIATDEAISQYASLFNQKGTRTVKISGQQHPLAALFNIGNEQPSRAISKTPKNWNLIRLSVKTVY